VGRWLREDGVLGQDSLFGGLVEVGPVLPMRWGLLVYSDWNAEIGCEGWVE
jgi:hypothetical protein